MSRFGVLLEMFYQLVVGIGPYSEAALRASNFFRHSHSISRSAVFVFNTLYLDPFRVAIA